MVHGGHRLKLPPASEATDERERRRGAAAYAKIETSRSSALADHALPAGQVRGQDLESLAPQRAALVVLEEDGRLARWKEEKFVTSADDKAPRRCDRGPCHARDHCTPAGGRVTCPSRTATPVRAPRSVEALEGLLGPLRASLLRDLDRPATAGRLAHRLHIGASGLSHHLRVLEAAGLIIRERRGREVFVHRTARATQLLGLYEAR